VDGRFMLVILLLLINNKQETTAMNTLLTPKSLRSLICECLENAYQDTIDAEEISEPTDDMLEPPIEPIVESQSVLNKLNRVLNKLSPDERKRLFGIYGYYTGDHLLKQLSKMKQADKGNL